MKKVFYYLVSWILASSLPWHILGSVPVGILLSKMKGTDPRKVEAEISGPPM